MKRKQKFLRIVAVYLALNMLFQYVAPTVAFALTSGPGQPEFSSFEPVGTSDMVDVYSGDFTYNIPLLSVPGPNGGYPINLAYHSGPGVDEEASWVGLGWNINMGAISRQLRGLPDDFDGDQITQRSHIKPNTTVGLNMTDRVREQFGMPQSETPIGQFSSPVWQVYYNNYKGLGYRVSTGISNSYQFLSLGLGLSFDSQNGIGVEPDFSIAGAWKKMNFKVDLGAGYNSRQGLQEASFDVSGGIFKHEQWPNKKKGIEAKNGYSVTGSSAVSFGSEFNVPSVSMPMRTNTYAFSLAANALTGAPVFGRLQADFPLSAWKGFSTKSEVASNGVLESNAYGYIYNSNSGSASDLKDFQRENIPYSKKVPNLAPSTFTFDNFSQSGQGTGSQFRSYANAVGVLSDRQVQSEDYSYPINLEFGYTPSSNLHFGAGFTYDAGSNQSGPWESVGSNDDVEFKNELNFNTTTKPAYESSPFIVYGDKTGVLNSEDHLANWGGDKAVKVKLRKLNDNNWLQRQFSAGNNFVTNESDNSGFMAGNSQRVKNDNRQRRSTNMEMLTQAQAHDYGFTRNIGYHVSGGNYVNTGKTFYTSGSKANHISEITTVQTDGMRYTYGLPAYNNNQFDGSFAVPTSQATGNFNKKTTDIPHTTGTWSVNNTGISYDEYDQQSQMGSYVHSWLLTSVVSSDYVDLSQDGPSDDDYGYWVRFNYDQTSPEYHWHVPYKGANYYEGKKGDPTDDRGSYSCGDREEYFLSSVETKTHIAIFYTSKREDGIASKDDLNGGMDGSLTTDDYLYKLDSIKLYTKTEFYTNIESRTLRSNPVALKTVHFAYNYDLCGKGSSTYYNQFTTNNTGVAVSDLGTSPATGHPDINGNKGKLTLMKVWFTYQTSERGELSPYLFDYKGTTLGTGDNPYYDPTAVDRWGNYKKLDNYTGSTNKYPYIDNPYTDQETTQSSNEQVPVAAPWCLKKITVPSGAVITINYESDDYAYVENQPAMRMFDIYYVGRILDAANSYPAPPNTGALSYFDDSRQSSIVNTVTAESSTELSPPTPGQYRVYFRLDKLHDVDPSSTASVVKQDNSDTIQKYYLNNGQVTKLYFRAFMDLLNNGLENQKDYASGYATIDYTNDANTSDPPFGMTSSTTCASGKYDLGFITLKGEKINESIDFPPIPRISPFIKAALQHLHFDRSELVHSAVPYATTVPAQISNLISSISSQSQDIYQAMMGFEEWAYTQGYGKNMDLNGRSQIRLYEPDAKKYGGGSRVKNISVNDNWDNDPSNNSTTDPDNYSYGVNYDYTMIENGRKISSGVCYEPKIGHEESTLTQPIEYVHSTPLISDEKLFLEKPLMENYYPGPSVGYRKVTVTSTAPETADLDDNGSSDKSNILKNDAAPITIYEFYTPKEFPVVFNQTDINSDKAIVRPLMIPGIYSSFTKRQARSQGYSIVLNDMAGKLRSITQRTKPTTNNPNGSLITKTEYNYYTDQPFSDNSENHLSSKVQVLLDDGSFQSASVGESHDIFIDMNENLQKSFAGGLEANLDVQIPPSVPLLFPSFFPQIRKRNLSMRTVVVNKIIYRTGIIKEVVATHEASTIKTENVAFDIETGEPLLTKTTNEFGDPVYQYIYPGHWYYAGLQGGYKNFGVVVDNVVNGGTILTAISTAAHGRIALTSPYDYLEGAAPSDFFTAGDEVWVDFVLTSHSDRRFHVVKVGSDYIDLVDLDGNFITSGWSINSIRIIHSGHDNMQSVAVGSLTLKDATSSSAPFPQYDPQNSGTHFTSNTSYSLSNIINSSAIEYADIDQIHCTPVCEGAFVGSLPTIVDPYAIGLRGLWRPYRSYVFETGRTQSDDVRTDGVYTGFAAFTWTDPASADSRWIKANTITKYSPHGFELENKDANNVYSSALYEYNRTLNTVVATNAKYKEIASDGFEDYSFSTGNACDTISDHWGFNGYLSNVTSAQAHTGKYSFKLGNGEDVTLYSQVKVDTCEQHNEALRLKAFEEPNSDYSVEDTLTPCDCIGKFSPEPDSEYMVSVWVKQTPAGGSPTYNTLSTYDSPSLTISYVDGSGLHTLTAQTASGPIIEGWQRIYYTFSLSATTTALDVKLSNNSGTSSDDYFDDIRIQPFRANMMTYVYDPITYRLVAQLDANNYATFYIYDEQGALEKVKVETEDGIKTVKEGRTNTVH